MPFPELEQYKRQSPQLAELLSEMEVYLDEVLDRSVNNPRTLDQAAFDIVPSLVAKRLGIDEGYTLVLLKTLEDANILVHRFHVYCPNTDKFLGAFESKNDLPELIDCLYEERTEHSINEYFVELVFNFSPRVAQERHLVMSV